MFPPFSMPPELQTMVEHHLGQQKQGEEPGEAAESTGTQESCPLEIPDTDSASRPGPPGIAQSMYKPGRCVSQSALPTEGRGGVTAWERWNSRSKAQSRIWMCSTYHMFESLCLTVSYHLGHEEKPTRLGTEPGLQSHLHDWPVHQLGWCQFRWGCLESSSESGSTLDTCKSCSTGNAVLMVLIYSHSSKLFQNSYHFQLRESDTYCLFCVLYNTPTWQSVLESNT